jgi:hypothetical protein
MREYNSEADDGQIEEMGGGEARAGERESGRAGERENWRNFSHLPLPPLPLSLSLAPRPISRF